MLCALIGSNQRRWISIARQETEFVPRHPGLFLAHVIDCDRWLRDTDKEGYPNEQSRGQQAIVGRWFTEFWGKTYNLGVVDELAAPDMLLQYSLHEPRRGRDDIKAFMTDFRRAFPDLNFWGTADLIAEGDYVVGQWEGGGTHTGPALCRRLMTIPGVGPVVALTYRVTVDVPARFRNSKAVGAVFGLTPSKYQSGQNDRTGAISRCGDEMMRVMLYEAAQSMLVRSTKWSWLKAWAMKIARHRGMKKAIVALARRLAVIMHRIWVDGTEFRWTREVAVA